MNHAVTSNASSALCHASCGFVVIGNTVAMRFLLCMEILHFDWLVDWLGPMVIEGALGVYTLGWPTYIHTQDGIDKSHSARKSVAKKLIFGFCRNRHILARLFKISKTLKI